MLKAYTRERSDRDVEKFSKHVRYAKTRNKHAEFMAQNQFEKPMKPKDNRHAHTHTYKTLTFI